MSRPWNKSLHLDLDTHLVRASLRPPWRRRAGVATASRVLEADSDAPLDDLNRQSEAARARAIDAVLSDLGMADGTQKANVSVALTDARVHFDVVSGDYGGYSDRQLQAIASACVAELLGDAAPTQLVRWQLQPDLRHLLICAIDRHDIETVVQAITARGLRLSSLQPSFCFQWNQHAAALPDGNSVFAVAGVDQLIVACAARGSITAFSCGPLTCHEAASPRGVADSTALDERVNRLLAGVGLAPEQIEAFVLVAQADIDVGLTPRWTLVDWQREPA